MSAPDPIARHQWTREQRLIAHLVIADTDFTFSDFSAAQVLSTLLLGQPGPGRTRGSVSTITADSYRELKRQHDDAIERDPESSWAMISDYEDDDPVACISLKERIILAAESHSIDNYWHWKQAPREGIRSPAEQSATQSLSASRAPQDFISRSESRIVRSPPRTSPPPRKSPRDHQQKRPRVAQSSTHSQHATSLRGNPSQSGTQVARQPAPDDLRAQHAITSVQARPRTGNRSRKVATDQHTAPDDSHTLHTGAAETLLTFSRGSVLRSTTQSSITGSQQLLPGVTQSNGQRPHTARPLIDFRLQGGGIESDGRFMVDHRALPSRLIWMLAGNRWISQPAAPRLHRRNHSI